MNNLKRSDNYPLHRRDVVANLIQHRAEALIVSGLGATSWDVAAAEDRPLNFPLWGAMGGAAMLGLGLALAQPRKRVLVITGDGELLMGLGGLATIAVQAPRNLAIVVIDNERYGETGMQITHTAYGVDLAAIAAAAGFAHCITIDVPAQLSDMAAFIYEQEGPVFATVKVRAEALPLVLPPRDGVYLKDRFRIALLGEDAAIR